jgi:hypothetical protein
MRRGGALSAGVVLKKELRGGVGGDRPTEFFRSLFSPALPNAW